MSTRAGRGAGDDRGTSLLRGCPSGPAGGSTLDGLRLASVGDNVGVFASLLYRQLEELLMTLHLLDDSAEHLLVLWIHQVERRNETPASGHQSDHSRFYESHIHVGGSHRFKQVVESGHNFRCSLADNIIELGRYGVQGDLGQFICQCVAELEDSDAVLQDTRNIVDPLIATQCLG